MMAANPTIPPTTPPTIAPVLDEELEAAAPEACSATHDEFTVSQHRYREPSPCDL